MRGPAAGALALAAALGAATVGCGHGAAPLCRGDTECNPGQRCLASAGVCVGFESPLLPAPDGGADTAPADTAPADTAPTDAAPADAGGDDAVGTDG